MVGIRNDIYSDEEIGQRAELDKIRVRRNEKEIETAFMVKRNTRISPKMLAARKEFSAKINEASGIAPNFSINASIPGREEIGGGFSKPMDARRFNWSMPSMLDKSVGFFNGATEAINIFQAFTVESRYSYFPKLHSAISDQLYPGEAVRVFTYANSTDGKTVSIESVHAPSLTHIRTELEPIQWQLGSLTYLKNPPSSFTIERPIQSGPMRPLHEFPTEHTVEQYRKISDRISKLFPDIR